MEEQIEVQNVNISNKLNKLPLALSKAQLEFGMTLKNCTNPFHGSNYADLSSIIRSTREALCNHELALMQFVSGDHNVIKVTTRLYHSSGEYIETSMKGKPLKQDAQSQGSIITYLRRYSQAAILNVAQEDDDANSEIKEKVNSKVKKFKESSKVKEPSKVKENVVNKEQAIKLTNLLNELGDGKVFTKIFRDHNISNINDLPIQYFDATMLSLNNMIEHKNKKDNK